MEEFEGINFLLEAIGETPIDSSYDLSQADPTSDVGRAQSKLLSTSRTVQSRGYWFNKSTGLEFLPNTNGVIPLPSDVLSIKGTTGNYSEKDHKVFDINDYTFQFDEAVSLDVIWYSDFDDLPYVVADYVVKLASVSFYNNVVGDTDELRKLEDEANIASVALQREDVRNKKSNLISGGRGISRTTNPTGVQ